MRNQGKVKMLWSRVRKATSSPYTKMMDTEQTIVEGSDMKKVHDENMNTNAKFPEKNSSKQEQVPKKEKKKRKGWKRFRHVALMTCRYIGIGVSHMSPMSTFPTPDYTTDPSGWYNSINRHHPYGPTVRSDSQYHWTTGILLGGW